MPSRRPHRGAALACALLALVTGCQLLDLREQAKKSQSFARIGGELSGPDPGRASLVVVIFEEDPEEPGRPVLCDYFVREGPGRWGFAVVPGTYVVAAFEDRDADLVYDDEPALAPGPGTTFTLAPGERKEDVDLDIPLEGRARTTDPVDIRKLELEARSSADRAAKVLDDYTVLGKVTTLHDPKFTPEVASMGLWRWVDFILTEEPGIYFLEPYREDAIPVLFVHGISGYPRQFETIVDHMDREHFQPWFYFYPSGSSLEQLGLHLAERVTKLQLEYGFDELAVVAHSMGGLVARRFLFAYEDMAGRNRVPLFVSISSPFGGDDRAAKGVAKAPEGFPMAPAWIDIATGSPFLDSLFYQDPKTRRKVRHLPKGVRYHLLYGFDNGGGGASGDGVLPLSSVLRPEVQEEAITWRAVDDTHVGILDREETYQFINARLAELVD